MKDGLQKISAKKYTTGGTLITMSIDVLALLVLRTLQEFTNDVRSDIEDHLGCDYTCIVDTSNFRFDKFNEILASIPRKVQESILTRYDWIVEYTRKF